MNKTKLLMLIYDTKHVNFEHDLCFILIWTVVNKNTLFNEYLFTYLNK